MAEAFEQIFGEAAPFEDDPHEGEEGDGQQQFVRKHRKQLVGEVAEEIRRDQAQLDGDEAEEQADGGQRKGGRIADHHERDQPTNISGAMLVDQQIDHCSGFS